MILPSTEEIIRLMDAVLENGYVPSEHKAGAQEALMTLGDRQVVSSEWVIRSNRPIIGKLICLAKRILRKLLYAYIQPMVERQNAFNTSSYKTSEQLYAYACDLETRVAEQNAEIRKLQDELADLRQMTASHLGRLAKQMEASETRSDMIQDGLEKGLRAVREEQHALRGTLGELHEKQDGLNFSLSELHKEHTATKDIFCGKLGDLQNAVFPPESESFDYLGFENRFRGDRKDILERQRIYLQFFRGRENILDLGCGRGEFVELLNKEGIDAIGVDSSPDSVAECQELGLPVMEADIFSYLRQLPSTSVGGVFCSQVIEHLPARKILELVDLLKDKLYIGAPVIFETINPLNLQAVNNWFYMDITHVRPVHPETLRFILESRGFSCADTLWLHDDEKRALPELAGSDAFNEKLSGINTALFGPQDYGVVAYNRVGEE